MELAIRYAILSYCPDLTDPDAESRPLAVVGVGDDLFGFYVVRMNPGDELAPDDVSRSVMNNLPALLQRQMIEGLHEAGPGRFLSWLHDRYRNSLHVSAIRSETVSLGVSVREALAAGTIVPPLLNLYARVVSGSRPSAAPAAARRTTEPARRAVSPPYYALTPYEAPAHA